MDDARHEVRAARHALQRVLDDIKRRLIADPSWHALRQLDDQSLNGERHFSTSGGAPHLWSQLTAQIDLSVPEWRLLNGIERAIAALDTALEASPATRPEGWPNRNEPPRVDSPPPLPAAAAAPSHARTAGARSERPADQSSLVARIQSASEAWQDPGPRKSNRSRSRADSRSKAHEARQIATDIAPASGPDGASPTQDQKARSHPDLHRVAALESSVDRLLKGDVTPHAAEAAAPAQTVTAAPDAPAGRARVVVVEEAEVEIVQLDRPDAPQQHQAPEAATLSRRLQSVPPAADPQPSPPRPFSTLSRYSSAEEATVEIVMRDGATPSDGATAAPGPRSPAEKQ